MATEKLIVELDARTADLESALDKINKQLDKTEENTDNADSSLKNFSASAKNAGGIVKNLALSAAAAASAISTFVVVTAKNRQELEQLARQAKLTTSEFSSLAFATKQFGLEADQIADITKDISDKLGEFARDASGPFDDFVNQMKLTKVEGQLLARQFEELSGDQVIGEMVRRMEEAGATGNEMTQVLESMGSDLSKLTPLFANNSAELNRLRAQYDKATGSIKLTNAEAKQLTEAATSFDLVTASLGKMSSKIAATIAPQITEFFQEFLSIVPLATQDLVNFLNTFKDANEIIVLTDLNEQIVISREEIEKLESATGRKARSNIAAIEEEKTRLEELMVQRKKLEAIPSDVVGAVGVDGSGVIDKAKSEAELLAEIKADNLALEAAANANANASSLLAIEERFKSEEQLLTEKYAKEQILAADNNALLLELKNEFNENLVDIDQALLDKQQEMREAEAKDDEAGKKKLNALERKNAKDNDSIKKASINAAQSLNTLLFEDNKAIGAGIIVADTAVGITKAFRDLPYPVAVAASASIAASGLVQLSNLKSATRGGGSVGSSGGGVGSGASGNQAIDNANSSSDVLLESLDVSGGSSEIVIRFEGNGDDITEALANNVVVMQRDGVLA